MKKIIRTLFLGTIFFASILILSPLFSRAENITYTTMPSPSIKTPTGGGLTGSILVTVGIAPSNVISVEIHALDSSNRDRYLGEATRLSQGTPNEILFLYNWQTTNYGNGQYYLYAAAKIAESMGVTGGVVTTYSTKTPVYLNNPTPVTPASQPTSKTTTAAPTSSPVLTTTPTTNQTPTIIPTLSPQATPSAQISSKASPIAIPSNLPNIDLLSDSQVFASIEFSLFRDKPIYLEKIEGRISSDKVKFLAFQGKSYSDSLVTITINSQPLVLSTAADSSGNWTYTLEKPLESGKHEAYVEVNINETVEKTGPYPFNIAQAQATADNPTGASLDLIDPQKQAIKTYLYLAGGLVGLAILVIVIFLYFKHLKKLQASTYPAKEK